MCILVRIILNTGKWPKVWKVHWIHPLFKRGSQADPKNYRGVHLTSQLSKVVERLLANMVLPFLELTSQLSTKQFAYRRGWGYKDVLLINVCEWLALFEERKGVLLYCSDVSAAFDRVSTERLRQKLFLTRIHPKIFGVLWSWLEQRKSVVLVQACQPEEVQISNQIYQGTVLGPPLLVGSQARNTL